MRRGLTVCIFVSDFVSNMDDDVRSRICISLDLESPVNGNDCRALAELLRMDSVTINWMWEGLAFLGAVRRTEYYFRYLSRKGSNATMLDVRTALREMRREDAVEIIDRRYPELVSQGM